MIPFVQRYESLVKLGNRLLALGKELPGNDAELTHLQSLVQHQHIYNPWFIASFITGMLDNWSIRLSKDAMQTMVTKYPELKHNRQARHVAVIPEENIPFAGIHDLVCTLLAGHHFYARNNNHNHDLLAFITNQLLQIEPAYDQYIHWCTSFPKDADIYLIYAKPSGDTALKHYFEKKHSLIRQKRISVGILTNNECTEDLKRLGKDIFTFFGLSNHSVRKIFVPEGYVFNSFFEAIDEFYPLYQYNRYANNYDYHKSVFMMDQIPIFDNGFLVLRQSPEHRVPIGCIYYEFYKSREDLLDKLKKIETHVQKIVTNIPEFPNAIPPGTTHDYALWEFDDHQDTLNFLLKQ